MTRATVTDRSWSEALESGRTVVVAFVDRTSTPCHDFDAELDRLAADLPAGVSLLQVDVGECPLTTRHFDVSSVPTVLVFRDAVLQGRVVGTRPADRLWRELSAFLLR